MTERVGSERRVSVSELDPNLRDRLLALDEPVSREDWSAVTSRVGARADRALRVLVAAAALAAASLAAILFVPFGGAGHTSIAKSRAFQKFDLGAPPIAAGAVASQTRVITSARMGDGKHTLYVAPAKGGGFCFEWTGTSASCAKLTLDPVAVAVSTKHVVGAISSPRISFVKIKFTDGTSVDPAVAWVAAPINAGFFLYDIPAGKTVAEIKMA